MKKLVDLAVEGAKVFDLVVEGDNAIEAGAAAVYNKKTKTGAVPKGKVHIRCIKGNYMGLLPSSSGIAFPTCISVNNVVAHFSPLQCGGTIKITSMIRTNRWIGPILPLR